MARGSIVKRNYTTKKGEKRHTYFAVFYLGKRQKWRSCGPNKKQAEAFLAQRIAEINTGTYLEPTKILFSEFSYKWLHNCPQSRVKPSTLRGYKSDIDCHLNSYFGDYYISQIDQERVEYFLSGLMSKRNAKTVNNIRLTLNMILGYARKLKYIKENPVSEIKPFKVEHKEMGYLTPIEIRELLKHSKEPYKTLYLMAILTGMRRGEIISLQWGDINWVNNTIFVRRSLFWKLHKECSGDDTRWQFITPKSRRSVRTIVMTPQLKKALEIHRINAPINRHDLVFCNSKGNPMDPDNLVMREFHPTLSMAGIRKIRFHDLRHTFATLLIHQSENVKFIQSQMGHASIQTTMDRYGHLLPCDQHGVGSRLDGQIFVENPPQSLNKVENLTVMNL